MSERPPWVGPRGQRVERLELHLSYACPNRCWFCSEAERLERFRELPVSWGRVATVLRRHAERGVRKLHLTGGEPTVHPRILDALAMARKLGMHTSVSTNGVMLARAAFAEQAVPLLDDAMFSLHGPTAAVHDGMTRRRGSFADVTTAIGRVRKLAADFELHVNIVVTRRNLSTLPDTVALANRLGARLIVVSNLSPEGRGLEGYADLAVRLERLAEALPALPTLASRAIVRFFGVPLCVLGDKAMLSNDLYWDPRVTVEWAAAPGKAVYGEVYSWQPDRKRRHVSACDGCPHRGVCMGVFDRYAELYPTDALRRLAQEAR